MDPQFWISRWAENRVGFHQTEANPCLTNYWKDIKAGSNSRVFVPLCGKSEDMWWLHQQGHSVLGLEVSPIAVASFYEDHQMQATQRENGEFAEWSCGDIEILCGDFFALSSDDLDNVEAVYDRASLISMPPENRKKYASKLTSLLSRVAQILLVTVAYPQDQMKGPPFAVEEEEIQSLYGASFDIQHCETLDVLADHQRFADRGVKEMTESVHILTRE